MEPQDVIRRLSVHLKFTEHSRLAMLDDELLSDDIRSAIERDEIIERYPDAKPFQGCLLFGRTKDGRPLHVVCALPT